MVRLHDGHRATMAYRDLLSYGAPEAWKEAPTTVAHPALMGKRGCMLHKDRRMATRDGKPVGCLTCQRPTYFQKRPAPEIGIGLWCEGCGRYEAFCACTPINEDPPSHML